MWIFILNKKLKFYTKEFFKIFNILVIAFGFIVAIIIIKYKPTYIVSISGEEVGYIQNKEVLEETIKKDILGYTAKNVDTVTLENMPKYELKLVNRTQNTNEEEILVALQKNIKITYKYYEIALNNEVINSVDTLEEAEELVNSLKEENKDLELTIAQKCTENAEEIKTTSVEVAKTDINNKITLNKNNANSNKNESNGIVSNTKNGEVNGIKLAVKPVTGTISSRYGVSSRIRSSNHTGLDIACSSGTPIRVTASGTVTFAKYNGSYGNLVKVNHGNGVETWYAHCSKICTSVGENVNAGDIIALVGSTGNSTGAHLHFEIRINGTHINPQKYIY
mgnify:FL=1